MANAAVRLQGGIPLFLEACMYETPKLEKFGTFRELTLSGGTPNPTDTSPYHRYGA